MKRTRTWTPPTAAAAEREAGAADPTQHDYGVSAPRALAALAIVAGGLVALAAGAVWLLARLLGLAGL